MQKVKITIEKQHMDFLNRHSNLGFKSKSSMVRTALNELLKKFETERLQESAALYAEIYNQDDDLKNLAEAAISDWPE